MKPMDDLTPSDVQYAWLPNTTIDDLSRRNLLAVAVLANFVRHAESYRMTITKLNDLTAKPGETAISDAYNVCRDARYLGRIEFTHDRPKGTHGPSGTRFTKPYLSRVPITDEVFADLVNQYRPGRFVLIPLGTGAYDDKGREIFETRRVRVLASEIYSHLGAHRIDPDGHLTPHENARGGRSRRDRRRAANAAQDDG